MTWGGSQRRKRDLAFWRWVFYVKAVGLGEPAEVLLPARVPGRIFWKGIKWQASAQL